MKIAILTIATNRYIDFVTPLYTSAQKHFCKKHEVTYYLFTNQDYNNIEINVKKIAIVHESWPNMTLKRYHLFLTQQEEILKNDYVYYCDADMKFVDDVAEEIISDRVVTIHPGFFNKNRKLYPYEKDRRSSAFIPTHAGNKYYAGGFNGGKSSEFIKLSEYIKTNIDNDLKNNIVAKWHDESHLNYYYNIVARPTLELSPSYCYPENWTLPFSKKLLALDKNHKEYQI